MKKLFFAVVLFTASTMAFAQSKTSESYNAAEVSRTMSENLELNEGQYVQVKALNSIKQDRYRDIELMYRNDPEMRQQKMDALNAEMDMEYEKVLRPEQYQSYLEMEGRATATANSTDSDQMNIGTQGDTEMKVKTKDSKLKAEPGKVKAETPAGEMKTKTNGNETKTKVKTQDGAKIKEEQDSDKYKYQDSRDNSKVKAKDDKLKIEDKNSKIKVEEDKVKIKSRD